MKKILSLCLILIIIVGLLSACQEAKNNTENNQQFSKIKVTQEPESYDLKYLCGLFGENYDSYQEALDEMVNRYNQTHDNEDLFRICMAVSYGDYIENSDELIIQYYYQFFETIWTDQDFRKEKSEYEEGMAGTLISRLYLNGYREKSLEFYDKYISFLTDKNLIISFTISYTSFYKDDEEPDNALVVAMYERVKILEKNYCNDEDIYDMHKIAILAIIADYADILNDTTTAKTYREKTRQLIQKLENEASDE
jgi:hypothetical protein